MSSFLKNIFNRRTLTILGALSIPAFLITVWFLALRQAEMEDAEYKVKQAKTPSTDNITFDHYVLKEVDDLNHLRWQLIANKGIMNPNTKDVDLIAVKLEYYDAEQNLKMRVIAPVGWANEENHKLELKRDEKVRVIAEGQGGKAKLDAANIKLDKNNKFVATGGVNILWPGVAKVSGQSATGSIASTDLKNMTIIGRTHAVIGLSSGKPM